MYTISVEKRVLRLRSDEMWRMGKVIARESVRMIGKQVEREYGGDLDGRNDGSQEDIGNRNGRFLGSQEDIGNRNGR